MQTTENHVREPATDDERGEPTTDEILGWLEFACWTMLVLTPILYYVNGPSVSTDQAVVRTALVVLSVIGVMVLRLINWRRRKRNDHENSPDSLVK